MGSGARPAAYAVIPRSHVLRPARSEDLAAVAEIEAACFASDPWPRRSFEAFIGRRGVTFLVCEDEGDARIAGYVILLRAADEGEVLNLAVSQRRRRLGIGDALLRATLDTAAAQGVRAVYLEVRESNVAARALYRAHGFSEVGRRRRYYERPVEDGLILQKVMP